MSPLHHCGGMARFTGALIRSRGSAGLINPRRVSRQANPCADYDQSASMGPKQIIILGGGFAGVYTARCLEKLLRPEQACITLVNRENYWVYQPMLPEVISGSIGLTNVVSPIRRLCRRTNLIMREVEGIDLKKQIVTVSPGFRPRRGSAPQGSATAARIAAGSTASTECARPR